MTANQVIFSGRTISIGGRSVDLDYPLADAFQLGDKIIVLFDPDAYTETFGQFRNLIAITREGEKLWAAELPTTESGDRYYRVTSKDPLIAYSIYSYGCEINHSNGKILSKTFIK